MEKLGIRVEWKDLELGKRIGSGAFGVVHKAILKTDFYTTHMAVKIIYARSHDSEADRTNMEMNIMREIGSLKHFRHRNIVALYGVFKDRDNSIYMMFPYADCGSLYNFLHCSDNNVGYAERVNWMVQCAQGMDYLHSNNVVHRDLKTQNLLLFDRYQTLKICDFGTVKQLTTNNTEFIGTIRYMAPELLNADGKYTEKCDVFSFGIIFWEVMSRKKPFEDLKGKHPLAIQNKIIDGGRPNVNDIRAFTGPHLIQSIIEACWDRDPMRRPSMKDLTTIIKAKYNVYHGDIEFGKLIGSGDYGEVYNAIWHTESQHKDVAVHILKSSDTFAVIEEMCIKLIYHLKSFKHENIIRLYDIAKAPDDRIYLLYELADCGSLYNCLHHTELEVTYVHKLNWMLQFVKGMAYMHDEGYTHRALKSKNLLLFNECRRLKIGDITNAKQAMRPHERSMSPESVSYMAPEVFKDLENCNKHSDVFSIGIIFWEIMSRKKPLDHFKNMPAVAIGDQIIKGARPNLNDMMVYEDSDHIKDIIEMCWVYNPEHRPTTNKLSALLHFHPKVFKMFPNFVRGCEPLRNICNEDIRLQ